jgi:hypothetical protein
MINQRTNQGQTIIKLLNYDIYNSPQTTGKPSNKPKANQGQTTDKPPANQNKEYKEYKESKESKELKENNNPPTPYGEGFDDPEKKLNFRARAYFEYFYRETFGEPYYWEAKDAGNMSGILKKLVFRQKKKGVSNPGDEAIIAAWKGFLSAVSGEWITDNFSVSIINSKFNAIISNYSKQKKKENETEEKRITYI